MINKLFLSTTFRDNFSLLPCMDWSLLFMHSSVRCMHHIVEKSACLVILEISDTEEACNNLKLME